MHYLGLCLIPASYFITAVPCTYTACKDHRTRPNRGTGLLMRLLIRLIPELAYCLAKLATCLRVPVAHPTLVEHLPNWQLTLFLHRLLAPFLAGCLPISTLAVENPEEPNPPSGSAGLTTGHTSPLSMSLHFTYPVCTCTSCRLHHLLCFGGCLVPRP